MRFFKLEKYHQKVKAVYQQSCLYLRRMTENCTREMLGHYSVIGKQYLMKNHVI